MDYNLVAFFNNLQMYYFNSFMMDWNIIQSQIKCHEIVRSFLLTPIQVKKTILYFIIKKRTKN